MKDEMIDTGRGIVVRRQDYVTLSDMQTMAKSIAESGMFGVKTEAQAMALMLLCQAEGIHPVMALRRYHIIENKPAYRADALQGEFEREGAILWHVRDEKECSATFWRRAEALTPEAMTRARERYRRFKAGQDAADLAMPGELTIIRTFADAIDKNVARSWDRDAKGWVIKKNWKQSPRQMLHARCLTEGVRAINPGLVAGIYTEDEIHDLEPETGTFERDHGVIEQNVREATAHAVALGGSVDQTQERDGATGLTIKDSDGNIISTHQILPRNAERADWSTYGPLKVTQENYKDRIAHFGKPSGRIIGKRVGDMEEPVIRWLYDKWISGLGPSASEDDMALKKAIEFAFKNLGSGALPSDKAQPESGEAGVVTQPQDIGAKQAAIVDLRDRIDGLVLTEEQAVSYLIKYIYPNVGANWKVLDDLPLNVLLEWCVPACWNVFKKKYEAEAKPKVKAKPTRKRASRK